MTSDRDAIEHIIDQELASILLQSIKLAEKENNPAAKDVLQIVMKVLDVHRSEREKST